MTINDLIATSSVHAFNSGLESGKALEQERIINLLEAQIQRTNTNNVDELAGLFAAITLIKGEQN